MCMRVLLPIRRESLEPNHWTMVSSTGVFRRCETAGDTNVQSTRVFELWCDSTRGIDAGSSRLLTSTMLEPAGGCTTRQGGNVNDFDTNDVPEGRPASAGVQLKLEVVVLPVADVDRALGFYSRLGWRLDADFSTGDGFRVVQMTPPGSKCSVIFGKGITNAPPGAVQDLMLIVDDIAKARVELIERGVAVSELFHDANGVFHRAGRRIACPDPTRRVAPTVRGPPSAMRTATAGCCRRSRSVFRGAIERTL